MRGITNLLAAAVLSLGVPMTLVGCEGAVSPDAEAAEEALALEAIQASVDLSGTWILNEEESDEPGPQGKDAGSHREGGPPGGPPEPPMGEGGPMEMERLTIEQVDGHVTLTDESGRSRTFHPTGEWSTIGGREGSVQVRSLWEENSLRVEIRGHRGEMTQSYGLGNDGDQLLITTRRENGPRGGPVELTRVYDRGETG